MNDGWSCEILSKLINSFFKHQDRDIQENFHKYIYILEICRKKYLSKSYFLFYFFVVFIDNLKLDVFYYYKSKIETLYFFILALELNKRKLEGNIV